VDALQGYEGSHLKQTYRDEIAIGERICKKGNGKNLRQELEKVGGG
jgi:hypothetical protein